MLDNEPNIILTTSTIAILVLLPLRPSTFNTKFCSVTCSSTLRRDQWEGLCDVPLHAKWNFIRMKTHYLGSVIFLPFNAHSGWTTEPQLFSPYGRNPPPKKKKTTTSHPMPKYEAYVFSPLATKNRGETRSTIRASLHDMSAYILPFCTVLSSC